MSQHFVSKMEQESLQELINAYHQYGKLLKIHFSLLLRCPHGQLCRPRARKTLLFWGFPQMETFFCNTDLCLSSQRCVFHLALNISPKLQGTSHSQNIPSAEHWKGYEQVSQRSQLREKHLCFGTCSSNTENCAVCPPNFHEIFVRLASKWIGPLIFHRGWLRKFSAFPTNSCKTVFLPCGNKHLGLFLNTRKEYLIF